MSYLNSFIFVTILKLNQEQPYYNFDGNSFAAIASACRIINISSHSGKATTTKKIRIYKILIKFCIKLYYNFSELYRLKRTFKCHLISLYAQSTADFKSSEAIRTLPSQALKASSDYLLQCLTNVIMKVLLYNHDFPCSSLEQLTIVLSMSCSLQRKPCLPSLRRLLQVREDPLKCLLHIKQPQAFSPLLSMSHCPAPSLSWQLSTGLAQFC